MQAASVQEHFDAAVVGGGPAGAAAARSLAAAGARVVLLEKERLPRYKTCGGGVVLRAARWADLPSGVETRRTLQAAELHFQDADLHFSVRRETTLLWTAMRAELDAALCAAAADAGAVVRDACAVESLETELDGVRVHTEHGSFRADYVVGADGARSRTARWGGWADRAVGIPALEIDLPLLRRRETVAGAGAAGNVAEDLWQKFAHAARFDFGTVPGGYAWVFPKSAHLSIGILSTQRGSVALHRLLERYARRRGIPLDGAAERRGALIPLQPRAPLARGRVLLCGDAAGLVDPVTCEGISYALRSGQLAARAIAGPFSAAGERPRGDGCRETGASDACTRYRDAVRDEIVSELRLARLLAHVLYRRVALRNGLFRRLGPSLCEAMVDVIVGARTYRELLASPKSYAKILRRTLARSS